MTIKIGTVELEASGQMLAELRDSSSIIDQPDALRQRMQEDGYLFIRGFHDRELVQNARLELLRKMREAGRLDERSPLEEGRINAANKGYGFRNTADEYPEFLKLVNHENIFS